MAYRRPVAKALRPITIRGVKYTILRLSLSARGPRFLLRDDQGRIFGAWQGAGSTFKAHLLEPCAPSYNPLDEFVFVDGGDALTLRKLTDERPAAPSRRYPRR